ncbi:MAG: 3-deoxy-manno-octulosonate cytidylyltransferase [bacterium]
MKHEVLGIIPARYKSSRFPGKPLTLLLAKPMVIWVAELTAKAIGKENTIIATDDNKIAQVVSDYDYKYIMTSENHFTGTDRLAEVANKIDSKIYINVQGDEPTLNPDSINKVIDEKMRNYDHVINAMTYLGNNEKPENPNIPKVVFNNAKEMVYMSRSPIPGYKSDKNKPEKYYKQVCIYAFNKNELTEYAKYGEKGSLENYEDIEILRFLDLNIPIKMIEVEASSLAVDVKEDIINVEKRLEEIHNV